MTAFAIFGPGIFPVSKGTAWRVVSMTFSAAGLHQFFQQVFQQVLRFIFNMFFNLFSEAFTGGFSAFFDWAFGVIS